MLIRITHTTKSGRPDMNAGTPQAVRWFAVVVVCHILWLTVEYRTPQYIFHNTYPTYIFFHPFIPENTNFLVNNIATLQKAYTGLVAWLLPFCWHSTGMCHLGGERCYAVLCCVCVCVYIVDCISVSVCVC